jgi:D-ornithine 4,5-aminomutase subunit beta
LSTVPPAASPTPDLKLNLPYAVALREFLSDYKMRAQMNTKYMDSSTREATVTHVLNLLISRLTSADIQSTITPDEGRNVPWHIYNIEALDTAKQAMIGMDDLLSMVNLKTEGYLQDKKRELQERAVLMMEEIIEMGGYFNAVEAGMFVDSGEYPQRNGDGISRDMNGGVGAGTVVERDVDYMAPVTAHYGYNNVEQYDKNAKNDPASLINGCTLEKPELIKFIDELDETDNVYLRMDKTEKYRTGKLLKPEVEWLGDGTVTVDLFFPTHIRAAEAAALVTGKKMNLSDVEVIHKEVLHPSEGTRIQIKGTFNFDIEVDQLVLPEEIKVHSEDEILEYIKKNPIKVVAGTAGNDEHSVGIREVLDIKHGGVEKYGIKYEYLGTSVPIEKFVDAAIETRSQVIMMSTIISHDDIHYKSMKKLHNYAVEKGVRDQLILLTGGTQVTPEIARKNNMDQGFGRGTKGIHIASFILDKHRDMGK